MSMPTGGASSHSLVRHMPVSESKFCNVVLRFQFKGDRGDWSITLKIVIWTRPCVRQHALRNTQRYRAADECPVIFALGDFLHVKIELHTSGDTQFNRAFRK